VETTALTLQHFACDLCGADDSEFLYEVPGALTQQLFRVVRCRTCALIYLNPRLSENQITTLYDRQYYSGEGFDPNVRYVDPPACPAVGSHGGRPEETAAIMTELNPPPAFHLDFGCGLGALLRVASKLGYRSEGYEVSAFARESVREGGYTVFDSMCDIPAERYDIVTAVEVLEHCASPLLCLRSIYRSLKPGGVFYYSTLNFDNFYERFNTKAEDPHHRGYIKPEGHIHFFSTPVMKQYFEKAGFGRTFDFEPRHYVREGRVFSALLKMGLIGTGPGPDTLLRKLAYYGGRRAAIVLGLRKRRLPLAQK
jgi:SAM-dependent methyltransferase